MQLDQAKIDALKAIKNTSLLINLIQENVEKSPKTALNLLNELGDNMEALGGIDLSTLESIRGEDGKSPVFGEDYMTPEEIDGLENFIKENIATLGEELTTKLMTVLESAQEQINAAVAVIRNVKDGKDGRDGTNVTKEDIMEVFETYKEELRGSPDSPLDVVEKIKQVRGSKRLGFKNIRGLPELEQRVRDNTDDIDDLQKKIGQEIQFAMTNSGAGGGGGVTTFTGLTDTPGSYAGQAGLYVKVNLTETGLEFDTATGGGEINNGVNVGTGSDVFKQKTGVNLEFRTLKAGSNVTITESADEIEFSSSGGGAGTDLSIGTKTSTTVEINSSTGADATIPQATTTEAGLLNATDKMKLNNTSGVNTGDQDLSGKQDILSEGPFVNGDKTKLNGIEAGAEVNNISDVNATDLTDGGDSSLHYHAADRNRANHTGTQTASTISDFDTEVSNNADVVANTAKVTNATHTGDVTGATALTVSPTAISGKTAVGSLVGTEEVLVNEAGTLKKTTTQAIADLGGGGGFVGFSVHANNQTISAATDTKVDFNIERYDVGGNFDIANKRFVAPSDGYYRFLTTVRFNPSIASRKIVKFFKNGGLFEPALYSSPSWTVSNTGNSMTHTIDIQLMTSDFVEVVAYTDSGTMATYGLGCLFSGSKIG